MRFLHRLLMGIAILAGAQSAAADETLLPSIQRIVDRGSLKIAIVNRSLPPMIRWAEDGKLSGFDVDLGADLARALDVEPQFVPAGPSRNDVIDLVASGGADIGLSYIGESVEWGKRVLFTQPYMIEAHTVFIDRVKGREIAEDCPRISDLRRLASKPGRLGVLYRNPYMRFAEKAKELGGARVFNNLSEIISALRRGEIVASVQGELPAKFFLSRNPETAITVKLCNVPNVKHRVSVAVRPDGIGLMRWLNIYIAQRGVIIDLDSLIYRADLGVY